MNSALDGDESKHVTILFSEETGWKSEVSYENGDVERGDFEGRDMESALRRGLKMYRDGSLKISPSEGFP